MSRNQPTGSVTGRAGWEWNRLQAAESATGAAGQSSTDGPSGDERADGPTRARASATEHRCSYRDEARELRRRVQHLEAELERRDRHLQSVIDHYERLLAEQQTRQEPGQGREEAGTDRPPDEDQLSAVLSRLLAYAETRRERP